jgi:hypothetical protein
MENQGCIAAADEPILDKQIELLTDHSLKNEM